MRIDELVSSQNLSLRWTYFPLHPETPSQGQDLYTLFAGRYSRQQISDMQANLQARCEAAGLDYDGNRQNTYNSRLAQELARWADAKPQGPALHKALYRAYFVDGINLADMDALVSIAGEQGLDTEAAHAVLEGRKFRAEIDADWQWSKQMGISGVPAFLANNQLLVGAQPYEELELLVRKP